MSTPRQYESSFKNHTILVWRDEDMYNWWYIMVTAPNGCYVYDGWWRDSQDKTKAEAVAEAKRGAMLT